MAISEAKHRANEKWNAKNYDSLLLRLPKGQKEAIQSAAKRRGESVNGFIWKLIQAELERDAGQDCAGCISVFSEDEAQGKE